jgi:hypothetical protein
MCDGARRLGLGDCWADPVACQDGPKWAGRAGRDERDREVNRGRELGPRSR